MIPYAVDTPYEHRPISNWLIFGASILAFIAKFKAPPQYTDPFILKSWSILGLLGYYWLHSNIFQLIGNLLFLFPIGNAVCSKIGNKRYLGLFISFSFVGGLIHLLISSTPATGCYVALSGVVGAYLVFFPENSVNCLFLFPRPVTLSVSSYFLIAAWLIADIAAVVAGVHTVTFIAHLLGLASGLGLAILALKKNWITMERGEKSLLQMLQRKKQEEPEETEEKQQPEQEQQPEEPKPTEKAPEKAAAEDSAAKSAMMEIEQPEGQFIRFNCKCGKRLKVPRYHAGAIGRCPGCKKEIKVPEK